MRFMPSVSAGTSNNSADWDPYSGEWHFSADYLLSHPLILQHASLVEALRSLVTRKETRVVGENDLVSHIFAFAEEHCRIRIFLFSRAARMFYALMQNAIPAKDGTVVQLKNKIVK